MNLPLLLLSLLLASPQNDDRGTCPVPSKSEIPELSGRPIPKASINDVHYVATVVLQVDLSENGSICDLNIVKSAGAEFDKEALQAISRTLFQPITLEGKPIPGTMLILRDYFRGNNSNTLYAENANAANRTFTS